MTPLALPDCADVPPRWYHARAARTARVGDQSGTSLAEMMVGLAVGLLVMAIVLKVGVLFDVRRKSVSGMSEVSIDGSMALLALTRELRMAGSGLGPPDALRCDLTRATGSSLGSAFPLWPLVIVNGAAGTPDALEVLASGKAQSLPAARLLATYAPGDPGVTVDSTFGVLPGDWLLLQQAGVQRCLLVQAHAIPVGAYRVEPETLPANSLPAAGVPTGSALINLGTVHRQRYSINADATLQLAQFDIAAERWSSSALAANVVNLQAQYGFDARPGPQAIPMVTWWSDDILDADGNGATGNAADWQRLLAVRIAVVMRSAQRKDGPCDSVAPTWTAGDPASGVLTRRPLSIGSVADARCFRYRVMEAEVPLRNLLWSDV